MTTRRIIIPDLEDAPPPKRVYWTQDDKIVVASYYGIKETDAIASYLGKTPTAVQNMAGTLGVSFTTTDEERDEIIAKIERGEL